VTRTTWTTVLLTVLAAAMAAFVVTQLPGAPTAWSSADGSQSGEASSQYPPLPTDAAAVALATPAPAPPGVGGF